MNILVGSSNKNKTSGRGRENSDSKEQLSSKQKGKVRKSRSKTFLYANDQSINQSNNQSNNQDEDVVRTSKTQRRSSSSIAKVGNDRVGQLDRMFTEDITKLEGMISNLDFREKSLATEWVIKLKQSNSTIDEMSARNEITSHLLKCCNQDVFRKSPFNQPPPVQPVTSISGAATMSDRTCTTSNEEAKNRYIFDLYNELCDHGKFLNQLPVPRDGAFFILHLRETKLNPK